MEYKLRPGMITLTWTSMNIEAYIAHVRRCVTKHRGGWHMSEAWGLTTRVCVSVWAGVGECSGLQKLEELVNNINDIIENRIEKRSAAPPASKPDDPPMLS